MDTIQPELATSWAWDDDQDQAHLQAARRREVARRQAVHGQGRRLHADKLQDKATDSFRKNPRKIWWHNLKEVTANGDHEVTFHLGRPQASFLALFATGYNPIYPCHVSAADMRTKPIGTGPFKFVEFKSNESVKLVRNPDYWRKGHPYIDAIEWRVISNRSTRVLAFVAGEFDMTFSLDLTVALMKDIQSQLPKADLRAAADQQHAQPDRQPRRRAVQRPQDPLGAGAVARPQGLQRHHHRGQGQDRRRHAARARRAAGACRRRWSRRCRATAPTSRQNRAEARKIMEGLGYGPSNPLKVKVVDAQHPALSRPRSDPDRSAQEDPCRGRARRHRHQRLVRQGRARRILGRPQPDRARHSTTPTSTSTRTTPAARSATTPNIATRRSRS